MSRRRLVPLGVAVTALLVVVAIAARGRPLSSGGSTGGGPSRTFFDYAFTTVLIVMALSAGVALLAFLFNRPGLERKQSYRTRTLRSILTLVVIAALVFFVGRHVFGAHKTLKPPANTNVGPTRLQGKQHQPSPHSHSSKIPNFRWSEAAIVGGLLLLALVAAGVARARARRDPPRSPLPPETLALALDESLDDLRSDPDLRRAIIATYARMELALAVAGLPRRPSEAPLEYVARALQSLDASAAAAQRLTDLFEWARFSQHEPEPRMRDEAIDALVAVRDELRADEPVAA